MKKTYLHYLHCGTAKVNADYNKPPNASRGATVRTNACGSHGPSRLQFAHGLPSRAFAYFLSTFTSFVSTSTF